jgi:hypothetical protein
MWFETAYAIVSGLTDSSCLDRRTREAANHTSR